MIVFRDGGGGVDGADRGRGLDARAVVRLVDDDGEVVGAGFLVGPDVVATCAHVVATATGDDARDEHAPAWPVRVEFPLRPDLEPATARVLRWSAIRPDGTGDVALLRLERRAPAGTRLPPLRRADSLWGHPFRVFGFPAGSPDGVWSTGSLRGEQGTRWFQLQGRPGEQDIEEGFSGSPVWDDTTGAVVGMTVATDRDVATTTAYMIPVADVLGLDPELLPCPYRGLEPFGEEHAEFFFGRDDQVDLVAGRVAERDVVVVAGGSGSGKSSLIGAGLVPRLRAEGIAVVGVRARAGQEVVSLVGSVLGDLPYDAGRPAAPVDALAATTPEDAHGLVRRAADGVVGRPVVVVDQFEEMVAADPGAAREALELLVELVGRVRLVLTVRPDSMDALLTPALARVVGTGTVFVPPMGRAELREAIVGPAERAPGLGFQEGLVDAILDDAGVEPGRLPLVESLLTQLWERRDGGSLTLAAYTEIGGVAGAVTRQAEAAVDDLPPADEPVLRRLLTSATRPDRDGRFVRSPVPMATPASRQAGLVGRLAAARLLVVTRGPDGAETVELAHQALIDHWPRLRRWLDEDRDFLQWVAQLDDQRARWEATGRDPGALLRGSPLTVAQQWLAVRPDDVAGPGREFVRLGGMRRRRDTRRRWTATAALATLVLLAGVLAVTVTERGDRLDDQVVAANANALGTEAMARAGRDPLLASRLALAAWRTDPASPAARSALARQATAMRDVDAVLPGLLDPRGGGAIQLSRDGSVMLADDPAGTAVITGIATGAPQRWVPPGVGTQQQFALSPDGAVLAGLDPSTGDVVTWDVGTRSGPVSLRGPVPAQPDADPRPLQFSPDGRRLIVVVGETLIAWDLATRAEIPHRLGPVDPSLAGAWLTDDPDRVLLRSGVAGTADTRLVSRSLSATAPDVVLPQGATVAGTGALAVTCVPRGSGPDALGAVEVFRTDTAAPVRRIGFDGPPCTASGALRLTTDREHVVSTATGSSGKDYARVDVIALRDGRTETLVSPFDDVPQAAEPTVTVAAETAAFRDRDGRITILRGTPDGTVLRLRGAPAVRAGDRILLADLTDDGRYAVVRRFGSRPLDAVSTGPDALQATARIAMVPSDFAVLDAASGAAVATLPSAAIDRGDGVVSPAVGTGLTLLTQRGTQYRLVDYRLPDLAPLGRFELPDPGDPEALAISSAPANGRVATLHGGLLALWDARTARLLGPPIPVSDDPQEQQWLRVNGRAEPRPGHPDEVLVSTPSSGFELWDVLARRIVRTIPAPVAAPERMAVSPDGERLAVIVGGEAIEVRDLDTGQLSRPPIPAPRVRGIVGFTGDGYLLTTRTEPQNPLDFWDLERGEVSGSLRLAHAVPIGATIADGHLELAAPGSMPLRLGLTARSWFDRLCATADRDFTAAELALLPPGTDTDRPCRP